MPVFDAIVIGGGINGLTVAAYLQKAGLSTVVLECRDEVGKHCDTNEVTIPGLRHNLHASAMITAYSPVVADLELYNFGFELIDVELTEFQPFLDGKAVFFHGWDPNITYKKFKRLSAKDAETYKRLVNAMSPQYLDFLETLMYRPATVENLEKIRRMAFKLPVPDNFFELTGHEFLNALFEDEHIKTAIAGISTQGNLHSWYTTVGAIGAFLITTRPVNPFLPCKGGSHLLPHALAKCIAHHGGLVLQGCPVERIVVKDGEAKGVTLSKYSLYPEKEIEARKVIVSNLTLKPTFIDLIGEEHLDPQLAGEIKAFDYNGTILFTAAYAAKEKPKWISQEWDADSARVWSFNYGAECLADIERMAESIERGEIPDPVVSIGQSFVYTVADPSQAPPGVESIQSWTDVPYELKDGGPEKWDEIKDEYLEKITERLSDYAPNFKRSIITSFAYSPLDVERRNPSAIHGTIEGGAYTPKQFYLSRPIKGFGAPRTPIKKLYLSNSIHPQATTNLAAGYNAACVVAEDLGIRHQPWWVNRPLVWWWERLKEKGHTPKFTVE